MNILIKSRWHSSASSSLGICIETELMVLAGSNVFGNTASLLEQSLIIINTPAAILRHQTCFSRVKKVTVDEKENLVGGFRQ